MSRRVAAPIVRLALAEPAVDLDGLSDDGEEADGTDLDLGGASTQALVPLVVSASGQVSPEAEEVVEVGSDLLGVTVTEEVFDA